MNGSAVGKKVPGLGRSVPWVLHIARTSFLRAVASRSGCPHRLSYNANPSAGQHLALAAASLSAKTSL